MPTDTLQIYLSITGLMITAAGLSLVYIQLRDVKRSIRTATHATVFELAADFRGHLVQYPRLRKYFFDGVDIEPEDEEYDRVVTIAELYLNYLEDIAVLGDGFGKENLPALERFSRTALEKSPVLRRHLSGNRDSYSQALHRILDNYELSQEA